MRDRLIELLEKASLEAGKHLRENTKKVLAEKGRFNSKEDIDRRNIYEVEADYLLADGWMRPPCRVGDTVYVKYYGEIVNAYVTEFEINSKGIMAKVYIDPDTDREYDAEDIYLTREEAEQALKVGEG